jgi:hypothetical protein
LGDEIRTLGAATLVASSGLSVAYLGPDLPAREIVDSVKPAGAEVLMLGLTTSAGKAKEHALRTIVRDLPKEVELWAGGRGAVRHVTLIGQLGLILRDYYNAYQQELVRIGGRVP